MNAEEWRPVVGHEGRYEVSDQGRVRSLPGGKRLGRVLVATVGTRYPTVPLYGPKGRSTPRVHRIVLEAFVGPCPDGMEGCHLDDDPLNNCLANLRWDTKSANLKDVVRNGRNREASKTHCPHGHDYTPENTYFSSRGRQCRTCMAARNAVKGARAKVERAAARAKRTAARRAVG